MLESHYRCTGAGSLAMSHGICAWMDDPYTHCFWEAFVSLYCSQIKLVTGFWNLNIQFWQELLCSQWISLSTLHFSLLLSSRFWNVVCNKSLKKWRLLSKIDRCSLTAVCSLLDPPKIFDCLNIPFSFHLKTALMLLIIAGLEFKLVIEAEVSVLKSHLFKIRGCCHGSTWWA